MFVSKQIAVFFCLMSCLFVFPDWLDAQAKESDSRFSRGREDAFERYVEGLLKRYDRNKDNFLDKHELSEMRRPPQDADKNGDGKISKQELVSSVRGRSEKNRRSSTQKRGGAVAGGNLQGLISGAHLNDRNVITLLGGAVGSIQIDQDPISARFNLIEFDPKTTLTTVRDLVSDINGNEHSSMDELVASIVGRNDVNSDDEVATVLVRKRNVKFHTESPGGGSFVTWKILLSGSEGEYECRIAMEKTVLEYQSNVDNDEKLAGEEVIQKAIMERIKSRNRGAVGGGSIRVSQNQNTSRKKQDPGFLSIDITIPFQASGINATLFSHSGRVWMLVARFDVDE